MAIDRKRSYQRGFQQSTRLQTQERTKVKMHAIPNCTALYEIMYERYMQYYVHVRISTEACNYQAYINLSEFKQLLRTMANNSK